MELGDKTYRNVTKGSKVRNTRTLYWMMRQRRRERAYFLVLYKRDKPYMYIFLRRIQTCSSIRPLLHIDVRVSFASPFPLPIIWLHKPKRKKDNFVENIREKGGLQMQYIGPYCKEHFVLWWHIRVLSKQQQWQAGQSTFCSYIIVWGIFEK